ncbi:hypothetical protein ACFP51_12735 [Streptomyces pratens]|uniref:MFS transporter n=1 Tax=Streptomyces pratens TaxID=887456 RepID=A0ABW1M167_9ACTN
MTTYDICRVAYRQTVCPPHLLGRMTVTMRFLMWSVLPVSGLPAGALGELAGVRGALEVLAAGPTAVSLILLCFPLRRIRDFEEAPAQ